MSLLASEFKWDGKTGTIDREKLVQLIGQVYECLEVTSDRTGRKMIFQDSTKTGIYISRDDPSVTIKFTNDDFPFKSKSDIRGKYFVITGTLSIQRQDLVDRILLANGVYQGSVTSQTDYLIVAPNVHQTSKAKAARSKGINIIDGERFIKFLDTL